MNTALLRPMAIAVGLAATGFLRATDAAPEVAHDNVVIVLDASGSMAERMPNSREVKMVAAKAALRQVLQQLPPDLYVGLLVFSGKNVPNEWLYPLGPRNDARLREAIEQPQPGSGTPLGAYLKKGADRLLQARAEQFGYGTFRLLVVTDGEAQDRDLVNRYTPEIVARGITIDVIGVAMNQRHTLATQVHSYRAANDPQALRRALAEVFAEVGRSRQDTAAKDAFAELAPLPDGIAVAAIQALATSGNQPIGERAPVIPAPAPPPSSTPQAAPAPPSTPEPPAATTPAAPWSSATRRFTLFGSLFGTLICCGIPVLVLVIVLRRLGKRSRR